MRCCWFCGSPLPTRIGEWPHRCKGCGEFLYNSPKPVVALIIPALRHKMSPDQKGLIVVRRGIEPHKGTWAFPGGYLDHGESWESAAVREAKEEVGVNLSPLRLQLDRIETTPNNYMVFFVRTPALQADDQPWTYHDVTKNVNDKGEQEILEIGLATSRIELGIPSHNRYMIDINFRTLGLRS